MMTKIWQSIKDYLSLNHLNAYFEAYFIAHERILEFFKNDIDIAVLDVRLKDMSGMELFKNERRKPQTDIIFNRHGAEKPLCKL